MNLGFHMHAERTPNPNSVKWVIEAIKVSDQGFANFESPVSADVSPLAARLFAVAGVEGIFLGPNFVTINKRMAAEWSELAPPISAAIKAWAEADEVGLGSAYEPPVMAEADDVESRIRLILDRDIRPFVAQDGGEVAFAGFSDGVVSVHLRGACAGCPSSTITLKVGIEGRLVAEIPEVTSVIAVTSDADYEIGGDDR